MASVVSDEGAPSSLLDFSYGLCVEGINPTCTHKALEAAVRAALLLGSSCDSLASIASSTVKMGDGGDKKHGDRGSSGDNDITNNNRGPHRRQRGMEKGSKKEPPVSIIDSTTSTDNNERGAFSIQFPTPRLWMTFPFGRAEVRLQSLEALYSAYGGLNVTHLDGNKLTAQIVRYGSSGNADAVDHHPVAEDAGVKSSSAVVGWGSGVGADDGGHRNAIRNCGSGGRGANCHTTNPNVDRSNRHGTAHHQDGGGGIIDNLPHRSGRRVYQRDSYNNNNNTEMRNVNRRYRSRSPPTASSSFSRDTSRRRRERSESLRSRRSYPSYSSTPSSSYTHGRSNDNSDTDDVVRRSSARRRKSRSPPSSFSSYSSYSYSSYSSSSFTSSSSPLRSYSPSSSRSSRSTTSIK